MEHETFWSLLCSGPHWGVEFFSSMVFDGLLMGLLWPFVRKHWNHHTERDKREGNK
jgi:hypothetical protein